MKMIGYATKRSSARLRKPLKLRVQEAEKAEQLHSTGMYTIAYQRREADFKRRTEEIKRELFGDKWCGLPEKKKTEKNQKHSVTFTLQRGR